MKINFYLWIASNSANNAGPQLEHGSYKTGFPCS